ncbi:transposase [Streptomyces sp. NPDC006147]|uniref:transposase n=1 Tax=Streptomyces sp. NPDC006147 TaxID=3155597 RepID=UPI0033B1AAB0
MWDRIEPLMPADPVRGRRWADHCRTLEAIAWKYRTCSPFRDLPDEPGSFQTAHKRLIRWLWTAPGNAFSSQSWQRLTLMPTSAGRSRWTPPSAPSYQHAAGARKKVRQTWPNLTTMPADAPAAA